MMVPAVCASQISRHHTLALAGIDIGLMQLLARIEQLNLTNPMLPLILGTEHTSHTQAARQAQHGNKLSGISVADVGITGWPGKCLADHSPLQVYMLSNRLTCMCRCQT
jgi:hypothetical protein